MSKDDNPKSYSKSKDNKTVAFRAPSRFSGGGGANSPFGNKSQYKPTPVRITQHKG